MDFSVKLAGFALEHPIMNAAGYIKDFDGAREIASSASSAGVFGSTTVLEREINPGNTYAVSNFFPTLTHETSFGVKVFCMNSLGLPNHGMAKYGEEALRIIAEFHIAGKPLIWSVAGLSIDEFPPLTKFALRWADMVELNLGCPHVAVAGKFKPPISFDLKAVEKILDRVEKEVGIYCPIGVKLSPFSNPAALGELAQIIGESKLVKYVATTNSFPNGYMLDKEGKPKITPNDGLAGITGPTMKLIGLGQVRQLRNMLPDRIQLVGVGGITTGQDVLDYLRSGAVAVQVATQLWEEGPSVFTRLLTEYTDLVSPDE